MKGIYNLPILSYAREQTGERHGFPIFTTKRNIDTVYPYAGLDKQLM